MTSPPPPSGQRIDIFDVSPAESKAQSLSRESESKQIEQQRNTTFELFLELILQLVCRFACERE